MKEVFKNKKILLISMFSLLLVLAGTTYAWFSWTSSTNTSATLTTSVAEFYFDSGSSISANNIGPVLSSDNGEYLTFSVTKTNPSSTDYLHIKFNATSIPNVSGAIPESLKYKVLSGTSNGSYPTTVAEGNLSSAVVGNDYSLAPNVTIATGTTYYKVIFWLDGTVENPTGIQGQTLAGTVNLYTGPIVLPNLDNSGANAPVLADGMIPIM
ncbi:MAG: hypothetical protein Q4G04_05895, partial [bacterium]|nr:hypothetical protein [bacterium]